jgi:hypothetical protein
MRKLFLMAFLAMGSLLSTHAFAQPYFGIATGPFFHAANVNTGDISLTVNVSQKINGVVQNNNGQNCDGTGLPANTLFNAAYYFQTPLTFLDPLTISIPSGGYVTVTNVQTIAEPAYVSVTIGTTVFNSPVVSVPAGHTVNLPIPTGSATFTSLTAMNGGDEIPVPGGSPSAYPAVLLNIYQ